MSQNKENNDDIIRHSTRQVPIRSWEYSPTQTVHKNKTKCQASIDMAFGDVHIQRLKELRGKLPAFFQKLPALSLACWLSDTFLQRLGRSSQSLGHLWFSPLQTATPRGWT